MLIKPNNEFKVVGHEWKVQFHTRTTVKRIKNPPSISVFKFEEFSDVLYSPKMFHNICLGKFRLTFLIFLCII